MDRSLPEMIRRSTDSSPALILLAVSATILASVILPSAICEVLTASWAMRALVMAEFWIWAEPMAARAILALVICASPICASWMAPAWMLAEAIAA